MASTSEIEKLERRYSENPDGRFFAPLADAYRKSGRLDRALELVRAGLKKHPDYLSAHIVLGRCLLDQGGDADAAATFQAVLALDGENIIALKSLAEIAERGGRVDEAKSWLQKLLVVDSMNTEAEADLTRLGGVVAAPAQAAVEVPAEPTPETSFADVAMEMETAAVAEPPAQPIEALPLDLPDAPPAPPAPEELAPVALKPDPHPLPDSPESRVSAAPLEVLPFDDSLAWGTGERSSRAVRAEDLEAVVHDADVRSPAIEFLANLGVKAPETPPAPAPAAPAAPAALGFALEEVPDQSLGGLQEAQPTRVELPADLSGAYSIVDEVPPPHALVAVTASHAASDLPLIMPEDVTPPEELKRPSAKVVQMVSPPPREDAAQAPMITETMGDLYLRQGFRDEAADVYRRLLSQRPGDAGLAAKLRAVEGPPPDLSATALGADSVGSWLKRVAGARLARAADALPPAAASETPAAAGGLSPLETAFAAPLPDAAAGEPAHPAPNAFSLDQIFGSAPEAPAPSASKATTPLPPAGASFDEFFGPPPALDATAPRPALTSPDRPSKLGDEDLTAFSAWLQGLKK